MLSAFCSLAFGAALLVCEPAQIAAYEDQAAIEAASQLIKRHEGLARCVGPASDRCAVLAAYPDPGVGVRLPTIGYGHTSLAGGGKGFKVAMGTRITRAEADEILRADLLDVLGQVRRLVKAKLTPKQEAALVSFTYNLGAGTLARTRERGLLALVNAGRLDAAARVLTMYCKAGRPPKEYRGLKIRRAAEAELLKGAP